MRMNLFAKAMPSIENATSAEEAVKLSGLEWGVEQVPLFSAAGKKAEGVMGVQRTDNQDIIGVTKGRYTPIQNTEVFSMFSGLMEQIGAKICNLGSVYGGSKIFGLATFGQEKVGNDTLMKAMHLNSSHDGTSCFVIRMATYRLVCSNGMMVEVPNAVNEYKVRHTQQYLGKFDEAREMFGIADSYYTNVFGMFSRMIDAKFVESDMVKFTENLFPAEDAEKVHTRTQNKRNELVRLFHEGTGLADYQNTKWAAFNAVTEYVDFIKTVKKDSPERRFISSVEGSGAVLRQKAFELLTA